MPASTAPSGSDVAARSTYHRKTRILNLFSGSYARTNGLTAKLKQLARRMRFPSRTGHQGGKWLVPGIKCTGKSCTTRYELPRPWIERMLVLNDKASVG